MASEKNTFDQPVRKITREEFNKHMSILEIDVNERDIKIIRKQYYKICLKYHPDKNPGVDTSEMCKEINSAFNAVYDQITIFGHDSFKEEAGISTPKTTEKNKTTMEDDEVLLQDTLESTLKLFRRKMQNIANVKIESLDDALNFMTVLFMAISPIQRRSGMVCINVILGQFELSDLSRFLKRFSDFKTIILYAVDLKDPYSTELFIQCINMLESYLQGVNNDYLEIKIPKKNKKHSPGELVLYTDSMSEFEQRTQRSLSHIKVKLRFLKKKAMQQICELSVKPNSSKWDIQSITMSADPFLIVTYNQSGSPQWFVAGQNDKGEFKQIPIEENQKNNFDFLIQKLGRTVKLEEPFPASDHKADVPSNASRASSSLAVSGKITPPPKATNTHFTPTTSVSSTPPTNDTRSSPAQTTTNLTQSSSSSVSTPVSAPVSTPVSTPIIPVSFSTTGFGNFSSSSSSSFNAGYTHFGQFGGSQGFVVNTPTSKPEEENGKQSNDKSSKKEDQKNPDSECRVF